MGHLQMLTIERRRSNICNTQRYVRYFFLKILLCQNYTIFLNPPNTSLPVNKVRFGFSCVVVLLWDQYKITRIDSYKFSTKKGNIKNLTSPSSIIIIIIILFSVLWLVHSPFQNKISTNCGLMFLHLFPVPCPVLKVILSSFLSFCKFFASPFLSFFR